MQGYLTKPNKSFGSKKRFFVLDRMTLSYYENEAKGQKLADIVLNAQTRVSAVGAQQINIDNVQVSAKTSEKTSYVLLCDTPQKRDQWIVALTQACGIEEAERLKAQREAEERARLEAEEAERRRREAEEAERRRLEAEEAERRRLEAEEAERRRREVEEAERRRREAEEAERRRLEAEEAERRRREAEDLALWEAQEAERLRLLALQQAVVEDIPESALDLNPRVETSQAVYKVLVAL
jgi:hypothetical protein